MEGAAGAGDGHGGCRDPAPSAQPLVLGNLLSKPKRKHPRTTYRQEPEGKHCFFPNTPFPDLLLSLFPIPATFSRFSFILGLGLKSREAAPGLAGAAALLGRV